MVETRAAKRQRLEKEARVNPNDALPAELLDHIFSHSTEPHTLRLVCSQWRSTIDKRIRCKACSHLQVVPCVNCKKTCCCVCNGRRCEWKEAVYNGKDDDYGELCQCENIICIPCSLETVHETEPIARTVCPYAFLCSECRETKQGCIDCFAPPCPVCAQWCDECKAPLCKTCAIPISCCCCFESVLCSSCYENRHVTICGSCERNVCAHCASHVCASCTAYICENPDCHYQNDQDYSLCSWCIQLFEEVTIE